jgi:hypothetical protein
MRLTSRVLLLAAVAAWPPLHAASAAERVNCRPSAIIQLRTLAPDGYAVYARIEDKKFFLNWITCEDIQLDLSTAVHESVHHLTADRDAFPLIDGGELKRPHEVSGFFAPSVIAGTFKLDDLVSTYLRPGNSSSASDFLYLLDELNAYSHDLKAAVALNSLRPRDIRVDHRDGLAALMAFMAIYVETAEESQPATWSGLQKPETAKVVSALWSQAETVMASSCDVPDFGTDDQRYIRQFCAKKPQSALRKLLGRAPLCPTECLQSAAKSVQQ